jgi:hypothetical protein
MSNDSNLQWLMLPEPQRRSAQGLSWRGPSGTPASPETA